MKNKKLEFEINGDILTVADFDWFLDRIDAIYVKHSEIGKKCEYAIFIQQGSEIVELYLRSPDEIYIANEYKKLCDALKEVNPLFDNSVQFPVLINYANLKRIEGHKNKRFLEYIINFQFKNSELNINGSEKKLNKILEKLNEINETNVTI